MKSGEKKRARVPKSSVAALESIETRLNSCIIAHACSRALPGKRVHATWDPLRREVHVYDCAVASDDRVLAQALLRELLRATMSDLDVPIRESILEQRAIDSAAELPDAERIGLAAVLCARAAGND